MILTLFFFLQSILPVRAYAGPNPIGAVTAVKGEVKDVDVSGKESVLKEKDSLFLGDTVTTGQRGYLVLQLNDQTSFTIGKNSSLVLDEFVYDPASDDGKVNAKVVKGFFRFVTGKIAKKKPENMEVQLPVGIVGIRGTTVIGEIQGERSLVILSHSEGESDQGHHIVVGNAVAGQLFQTDLTVIGFGSIIIGPEIPPTEAFEVPRADIERIEKNLAPPNEGDSGGGPFAAYDSLFKKGSSSDNKVDSRDAQTKPEPPEEKNSHGN